MEEILVIPTSDANGLGGKIADKFARSEYLTILVIKDGKLELCNVLYNEISNVLGNAGYRIVDFIRRFTPTAIIVDNIGANAFEAVRKANIKIFTISKNKNNEREQIYELNVKEIFKKYQNNELIVLEEPNVKGFHGLREHEKKEAKCS
ncbi:MAG: NifB/NifX family molybdenum-iron cluster-binding protein [Promethearchaeota archaeon]